MHKSIHILLFSLLALSFSGAVSGKNLSILSSDRLENFELLDVYISGELAYIPAGLGGLNIVDISDPVNPQVVGNYHAPGCDWGRMYAWSVAGDHAYGVGRECGVHILNVQNPADPQRVGSYSDPDLDRVRYEHGEIYRSHIYLSRHQAGVEVANIEVSEAPVKVAVIPTQNAWASLAHRDQLYVADGASGVKVISIADPEEPQLLASHASSGTAKDLSISGERLFVAVGAAGVDMYDISDPAAPVFLDNYNTTGYASRVASNDSLVAVSDWDDVEVLRFTESDLSLAGYKNTGGRVMAIAMIDEIIFSAEWEDLVVMEYGSILQADMDLSISRVDFPRVQASETAWESFQIENNGGQDLVILPLQVANIDFEVTIEDQTIPPGSSTTAAVSYQPGTGGWTEDLTLETSDPDESSRTLRLTGNHPFGPMIGDTAPAFDLPLVNRVGRLSNEDLSGSPAVLAFFTAW